MTQMSAKAPASASTVNAMSSPGSHFIPRQADASDGGTAHRSRFGVEGFPAGRLVTFGTDDFDEFQKHTTGWSVQYHPLDAGTWRSTVALVRTTSLQLARVQHTLGYSSQGENPVGTLSIAVPVDDARLMVHRGHGIGPTQMALIHSGEGYECVARSGARFLVASVPQERVERYAADLWHKPDVWRDAPDRLLFSGTAHRLRYVAACERILGTVAEQPGVVRDPRAAHLLEETFLESLFLCSVAAPSCSFGRSRFELARRAYRYLLDHAEEVPSIREVCAATGVSYPTLERGFHETYGMTPKVMMTAMRLSQAKRELLHPGPATTVTDVALRRGFVELGRFSVRYRQRYGEAPSETLRRARGGPVTARA